MSYCELVFFRQGKAADGIEFRNSWGGSARIWDALFNRYLKDPDVEYDSWLTRQMKPGGSRALWDLGKRRDLPEFERAVMMFTYDFALVKQKDFPRLAADLRKFAEAYPVQRGNVDHLVSWADAIEIQIGTDADAVAVYGTSCGERWMSVPMPDDEDSRPYDMAVDDKHWDIYEELGNT